MESTSPSQIASELLALHVSTLLLERVTEDSIEVCVSFLQAVKSIHFDQNHHMIY